MTDTKLYSPLVRIPVSDYREIKKIQKEIGISFRAAYKLYHKYQPNWKEIT